MVFTDEHDMFRSTVREFVDAEIEPYAEQWESDGIFPAHEQLAGPGEAGERDTQGAGD